VVMTGGTSRGDHTIISRRRIVERVETLTAAYWRWRVLRRARDRTASAAGRSCIVVAPHPDDETFACGALIARKLAAGTPVHVLVLTDGGASHPGMAPEQLAAVRRAELARACQVLGLGIHSVRQLDYPDGRLAEHIRDASEVLSQTIRELRPDDVLVTSQGDGHPDHVAASSAVRAALRLTPGPDLVEYPVWSWYRGPLVAVEGRVRTLRLLTDVGRRLLVPPAGELVAVEHHGEAKSRAIEAYRSQVHGYGEAGVGPSMPAGFVDLFLASHEVLFRDPTSR